MAQALWFLLGLGLGLALDFLLVKVMLRSVEEKVLALESARVLERLNLLESELRWQMAKAQALIQGSTNLKARVALAIELESARVMERVNLLESELRWQMAKAQALELDLERANQKLSVKAKETVQELLKEKGLEQVQE